MVNRLYHSGIQSVMTAKLSLSVAPNYSTVTNGSDVACEIPMKSLMLTVSAYSLVQRFQLVVPVP